MAHLAVTVVLLFFACIHAAPAPEPNHPKFVFVKNSAVGTGVAGQYGKVHGSVESNQFVETPIEAPVDTAPEPNHPKFVFVKNSAVGTGVAGQYGKVHGSVESNQFVETPIEAPVDTGNNVPDVVILDNVNAGAAFADSGNVATGVVKNNEIADNSKKDRSHSHEPSNPKFTFAKDSALGLGVARQKSKAHGLVESNKIGENPMEEPADTGNNAPDVAVLDNVNAGAAFAASGSIATGVLKNNKFADNPIKGAYVPFIGFR